MGGSKREGALTIFELHKLTPVFRRQLVSNCFLHAPAVAHCYLLQNGTGSYHGMMDLAKFVRHNLLCDELATYTMDGGGDAVEIFSRILHDPWCETLFSITIEKDLIKNFTEKPKIWRYLAEYGPALVSTFRVDKNFAAHQDSKRRKKGILPSFSGTIDSENVVGQHAMVLIGMECVDGEWTLLLQNWWTEMQFLQITAEYLVSSGAKLVWAKEPQTSMVADFPVSGATFAETHVDGCDRRKPELVDY